MPRLGWKPDERELIVYYVVRNPATEKWVIAPATEWTGISLLARLGFDPAVSSHFHVYEFVHQFVSDTEEDEVSDIEEDDISDTAEEQASHCDRRIIKLLATYSSKAGTWTHQRVVKHNSSAIRKRSRSVFLNGFLYLAALGEWY
jgi:hypothetical protein